MRNVESIIFLIGTLNFWSVLMGSEGVWCPFEEPKGRSRGPRRTTGIGGVGADAVLGFPGRQYQKDQHTNRTATRKSDTPWARMSDISMIITLLEQ